MVTEQDSSASPGSWPYVSILSPCPASTLETEAEYPWSPQPPHLLSHPWGTAVLAAAMALVPFSSEGETWLKKKQYFPIVFAHILKSQC